MLSITAQPFRPLVITMQIAATFLPWLVPFNVVQNNEAQATEQPTPKKHPNIVCLLCDDLRVGDLKAFNAQSKISTPAMERLASQGMRCTNAHSGSAVCTPTRYGILCGQ